MQVTVNGEPTELPDGYTVAMLLVHLNVVPVQVAVEQNHRVVPRRSYAETALADGDQIEIVTFVGGG